MLKYFDPQRDIDHGKDYGTPPVITVAAARGVDQQSREMVTVNIDGQRKGALNFGTGSDTARANDAFCGIKIKIRITGVFYS